MLEVLLKYHPDYENNNLSEEKVFSEINPGKEYSYTLFKNLLSDLYEHAKIFLTTEEMSKDKLASKNLFLKNILRRNSLKELITKEINIAEQLFENENLNPDYFDYYYFFRKNVCKYYSTIDQNKVEESSNLELEGFFSMISYNLLTYELWFQSYKVMLKPNIYTETVDKILDTLYSIDTHKKPVKEIFYKVIQLLKTDDEKHYFEIMKMLKDENKFLNSDSKLWVYQPLEVFLINRVRNGEERFYRPQFELYKHCFEYGVFDFDYAFAQGKLIMTVETAIRIKEFAWIEEQINKYRDKGPKDIREDYYNFNMSKVLQAKGENDKALDLLNKIDPDINQLKSMVRNMQMKIFYELGYYELAKSQIDTYRHYISREQDFSEVYKESVYNFLKLYNKLVDLKLDNSSHKLDDFEYDIGKSKNTILKQWLIDKVAELKKGTN